MNDYTARGQLIDHAIAQTGEIDEERMHDDPALLNAMTARIIEVLHSKHMAYEALMKDTSRSTKVGFQVNGSDSGIFDSMLMSYGYDVLNKALPVSLSVAARLLKMRGIVNQHEELCPMVVSSISAFSDMQASVMLSMADTNSIAEHDLSTLICSAERIQRQVFRNVNELDDETLPGCLIIDCFRNVSIADVIDAYRAIASNELYGEERLVGYYLFPFEHDFLAHVLRYRAVNYTLSEEDGSGKIIGCGLNYSFEGQDIVFYNETSVFHIKVDDYVNLVFSTDFDANFGDYRLVNEVNEIVHGMMIKRINVYKKSQGDVGRVIYNPSMTTNFKLITGYRLIDGRVTPQPYQVDGTLYDKCYEAVLTLTQLTIDNVRVMVTTQSQTLTSILGRTTQSEALESDKVEAITMSLYIRAFSATYDATQILKSDYAVQGKSLDDFDKRFKRSCLTIASLCTIFPIASLLPVALLGQAAALTSLTLLTITSTKFLAVKMIETVAELLVKNKEWESMTGLTIDQDEFFSVRVEQDVLDERSAPLLNGMIKHQNNVTLTNTNGFVTSAGKHFELVTNGFYFDATGKNYESLATRINGKLTDVQLYSRIKSKLAVHKIGELYSTKQFNGVELQGYSIFNEEYRKTRHFVAGYSYFDVTKEDATHTFFDTSKMAVRYCRIIEKYIEGEDIPFLGLQTLKGLDSVRTELAKLQINSERLKGIMQINLDSPLRYYEEGIVVCDNIGRLLDQEKFVEVGKGQVYSTYLRKNNYTDVHITIDLYLERLKQLAKYVAETGDSHVLFGKVLEEWYSIRSDEPVPGLLAYYDRKNDVVKYIFDKTDLNDIVSNSGIVRTFNYMLEMESYDEDSDHSISDEGTMNTVKD